MVIQKYAIQRIDQSFQRLLPPILFQLAFPNRDAMPTHFRKFQLHVYVTLLVPVDFRLPKIAVCARNHKIFAAFMPMPEATIDENTCAVFPQDNIRFSWQPRMIQPITESIVPQIFAHNNLRLGVLPMDGRHAMMPLFWSQRIGHYFSFHRGKNIENIITFFDFLYFCKS